MIFLKCNSPIQVVSIGSAARSERGAIGELTMRWFHVAVVVLFAAITIIFAAQNLQVVTVSFLRTSIQIPLAFLTAPLRASPKKFGPATDAGATNFVRSTQAHNGL